VRRSRDQPPKLYGARTVKTPVWRRSAPHWKGRLEMCRERRRCVAELTAPPRFVVAPTARSTHLHRGLDRSAVLTHPQPHGDDSGSLCSNVTITDVSSDGAVVSAMRPSVITSLLFTNGRIRPNQPLDDLSLYQAACTSCHAKRSGSQGGQAAAATRRSTAGVLDPAPPGGSQRSGERRRSVAEQAWDPTDAVIRLRRRY
jgi:hypothetical protein